jgi:hypothetical protein
MNAGPHVLRSSGDPQPEGASRQPYSVPADISIRLWSPAQLQANSQDASWKTGSNLVCMIADVVSATHGIPADELRTGMSAHFNSAAQAVKAAKSIERAVIEFSRQRPDDCFGVAIAVHRPIELRPFLEGDPGPVSPATSLLRNALPGQILLSRETYEPLRSLPGLQFRPLNADAGNAPSGDNELLWTSPQNYERFAALLQEAIQRQPIIDNEDARAVPEENKAFGVPQTKSTDFRSGAFSTATFRPVDEAEESASWMASHRLLVSLAAVGVLALATVYALPSLRKAPTSSTKVKANDVQQPAKPEPPPDSPTPVAPQAAEPAKIAPTALAPIRKPIATKTSDSPVKPPVAKPLAEYAGFNAKDIPLLLKKAERDAGAGDYDSSRREYDVILHLEPNNQAARLGMSRLNLSVDRK